MTLTLSHRFIDRCLLQSVGTTAVTQDSHFINCIQYNACGQERSGGVLGIMINQSPCMLRKNENFNRCHQAYKHRQSSNSLATVIHTYRCLHTPHSCLVWIVDDEAVISGRVFKSRGGRWELRGRLVEGDESRRRHASSLGRGSGGGGRSGCCCRYHMWWLRRRWEGLRSR